MSTGSIGETMTHGADRPTHGRARRRGRRIAVVSGAALLTVGLGALTTAASAATVGGQWHFDETSGQVATDSSGSGGNGTVRGAVTLGQAGYQGTAFGFGPTNAWVEVPSADAINPGTRDFRADAWIRFSEAPGSGETYDVIRKGLSYTAGGEFKLEIISGGRARCIAKDAARVRGAIVFPKKNLADGRWHHVGCARTGAAWQVLVDGVTKSKSVGLRDIANGKSLSIGSKYGTEDAFPGLVDEVELTFG